MALDIDATLEHVQDPQNSVKVQVSLMSSQITELKFLTSQSGFGSVSVFSELIRSQRNVMRH